MNSCRCLASFSCCLFLSFKAVTTSSGVSGAGIITMLGANAAVAGLTVGTAAGATEATAVSSKELSLVEVSSVQSRPSFSLL